MNTSASSKDLTVRFHVVIEGRVQGVFFRQSCLEVAASYDLGGWVRNTPDGNVEAVFEGNSAAVRKAIEWCYQGPPLARVDRVTTYPENVTGERSFRIT
ncbi:MAG: acylphosphatase [Acidimicrobiales bacterium]